MGWMVTLASGLLLQVSTPVMTNWEIPIIVIQGVQILAWGVNIIVGAITIYKWYKKKK